VAQEAGDEIEFRPVSLTTLIDSPVSAGAHYKTIELGSIDGAAHYLHIAADSERALAIAPDTVRQYKKLVAEAGAMFGVRHYRSYHFLLTLSNHMASFGLEHHESSDDRLDERTLIDESLLRFHAELLPHEFVHSWNGKYRRPAGLVTKDFSQPMQGDLLWVYEGLTEYLGSVLTVRSGLESPELFRDRLAYVAAHLDHESGRTWRPLADTAISGQLLFGARDDYAALRRGLDFYGEAQLVWLEVDTLLRQLSHGTKSIDDFCRAFYGGEAGVSVNQYTLEDITAALNQIQAHDWSAFFRRRVEMVRTRPPLAGIENAGWRLSYGPQRSDYWNASEEQSKVMDEMPSLGVSVKNDGMVQDVEIGGPIQIAGIAPGAKITSVNGRQFSAPVLRSEIHDAASKGTAIELVVKNGEYFSTHKVDCRSSEKYPYLERRLGKPDGFGVILRARTN